MTFLTLYHGDDPNRAHMVAISLNPELVREAAEIMLRESLTRRCSDPTLEALEQGRRQALRLLLECMKKREGMAV